MKQISGIIYMITSKTENKSYIGQTVSHLKKYKKGVMYYSRYGAVGRFSNHITQSKNGFNSPIHKSIRQNGKDDFVVSTLLECKIEELDEKEQQFIVSYNSIYPNGYNVQQGGECYKMMAVKIQEFSNMSITKIELKTINKNGIPDIVRIYIENDEKKRFRLNFCRTESKDFDSCLETARDFISQINTRDILIDDMTAYKYQDKLNKFIGVKVNNIEIITRNSTYTTYVVCVKTDKVNRISFGGKKMNPEIALEEARNFVSLLKCLDQSRQQATALEGDSPPLEINSVSESQQ